MKVSLSGEKQLLEIISGFTITEQFNETLDSSAIKFRADHRLKIKPYDECCFENGMCMLVDSFVETQESLETEQYLYTINLMSLTKLLEKIQLPNRAITHSLVSGQNNIIKYIDEYLELYSPKIRVVNGNTWEKKQLIVNKLNYAKYSVKCRDFAFSKPTLRQALTSLMLQIGCIPVLKKNFETNEIELHDIDFRAKGENITELDNYCNYITRSNSSDSYVNTLAIVNENMLDEHFVSNEIIGFRDAQNIFLKQTQNLKLETKFPIYNVNKFVLNVYSTAKLRIADIPSRVYHYDGGYIPLRNLTDDGYLQHHNWYGFLINVPNDNTIRVWKNTFDVIYDTFDPFAYVLTLSNIVINEVEKYSGGLKVLKTTKIDTPFTIPLTDPLFADAPSYKDLPYTREYVGENNYITIVADVYWEREGKSGNLQEFAWNGGVWEIPPTDFGYLYSRDITPLCLENSKRQLLDTDFLHMTEVNSVEQLEKYIYGTVGYNIGTNVIEGFSQTYSKAAGWWQEQYTYIENIFNAIRKEKSIGENYYYKFQNEILGGLPEDLVIQKGALSTITPESIVGGDLFTNIFFSIEYQALNKMRIDITKDDIEVNIPIAQYDSNENSITNANDLIIVEQQKADRLGNDIITINQRIPLTANSTGYNLNDRILGEYVIFKKEVQYNPYDIQIVYIASKDYVLQNYFTAIQTKYRAYEYVDYGESVLRQENTKVYCLIDKFAINNDNDSINLLNPFDLVSAITNDIEDKKLKYIVNVDDHKGYKSDLSIISAQNTLLFTYIDFDSVSHGIYIRSTIFDDALGGLPQQWYIKTPQYLEAHTTYFAKDLPYFNLIAGTIAEINELFTKTYAEPLIALDSEILNSPNFNKKYYLDQQEKLNETLQFEYFTTNKGIKWTTLLQELCLLANNNKYAKVIYFDNNLELNEIAHTVNTYYENIEDFVSFNKSNNNFRIWWDRIPAEHNVIKFAVLENGQVKDIMAVDNTNTFVYMSILETKSLKVGSYRNGCLVFDEYEIAKNNVNKIVNRL